MMDKEQIKTICDDARVITDNDNKMIRCHINIKYFDCLIEQAERVQELEKELTYYKMATESYFDMEQQNQRYREAIEGALNVIKYMPSINGSRAMSTILSEALEEESE